MTPQPDYQVDFEPVGKRVEVPAGTTLLEAARQAGITLSSACGGEGSCGQCRVRVVTGAVSAITDSEDFILTELELHQGDRLACCTRVEGEVKVIIPAHSLITNQRLQVTGHEEAHATDPLIAVCEVAVPAPTLEDPRADFERVAAALAAEDGAAAFTASPAVITQIATDARRYDWRLSVYVRDRALVGIAPAGHAPAGLAVDLGTTKLAAYLVDLQSGEQLAAAGAPNPQIGYGEDVISRLVFTRRHEDGGPQMARLIREALDNLLGQLVAEAGVLREQVADVCIVGNTAMTHLLLELPVGQLATAPYVAATNAPVDVPASALQLVTAPGAQVHILPCIGGFVGADHVAMALAAGLDHTEKITIGIDIGTNTEITLARPGEAFLASVSCASGPAFEGAHISDGMRAASGAIEAVRLGETAIRLKTIDDTPPVGLCGSGIIDTVAELYRWGVINWQGRFRRDHPRVREGRRGPEVILAPASQTASGRDVVVTQEDVNEIQLAKGAIRAGLDILLDVAEVAPEHVEEVLIAGAFGSYINIQSALDMGLLPRFPQATYRQIGNAAALGARQALVSRADRRRAQRIAERAQYTELTTHPRFSRLFAQGMYFPRDVVPRPAGEE